VSETGTGSGDVTKMPSQRWRRRLIGVLAVSLALLAALAVAVWVSTYHPAGAEAVPVVCQDGAGEPGAAPPRARVGQPLKVMTWNVQFMAGKGYVFFYDVLDGSGPDERPSPQAIAHTLDEVARVVRDEDPDVLLLQEVDDGAARTDGLDELAELLRRLPGRRGCHAAAWYWKAAFVPHPRILGRVGMKLVTLSRYEIARATRYQLPEMPADPLTRQFQLKRAVLETVLPMAGPDGRGEAGELVILNTHLDAFAQGSDTMERQVTQVLALLAEQDRAGRPWVLGGDFNLLATRGAYERLGAKQRAYFNPSTELAPLTARYRTVPSPAEIDGPEGVRWTTHFPNDPAVDHPDRTLDYLVLSPGIELGEHRVRRRDTLAISDHLPVVATITAAGAGPPGASHELQKAPAAR